MINLARKCNNLLYILVKPKYNLTLLAMLFFVLTGHAWSGSSILKTNLYESAYRPYAGSSPWNLKIGSHPEYELASDYIMSTFTGVFGSDPDQYTLPVYIVNETTPLSSVTVTGTYSNVTKNGERLALQKDLIVSVPLPDHAKPAKGSDGQVILWNPVSGDEWGFWRIKKTMNSWTAVNGYHYNTQWSAVPPMGFLSRGAGIPYLAGLIRPWEIKAGKIEHAIAVGINSPNKLFIYPATKSDGKSMEDLLPMGARLQLNPLLTESDLNKFGLDRTGKIIARALQEYGMIVIDGSGHPKIYAEYTGTANWNAAVLTKNSVKNIPYSEFRVLKFNTPRKPKPPEKMQITISEDRIRLSWEKVHGATAYRILRSRQKTASLKIIATDIAKTQFVDTTVKKGKTYYYSVSGVNHNGIGEPSETIIAVFP